MAFGAEKWREATVSTVDGQMGTYRVDDETERNAIRSLHDGDRAVLEFYPGGRRPQTAGGRIVRIPARSVTRLDVVDVTNPNTSRVELWEHPDSGDLCLRDPDQWVAWPVDLTKWAGGFVEAAWNWVDGNWSPADDGRRPYDLSAGVVRAATWTMGSGKVEVDADASPAARAAATGTSPTPEPDPARPEPGELWADGTGRPWWARVHQCGDKDCRTTVELVNASGDHLHLYDGTTPADGDPWTRIRANESYTAHL